MIKLLYFLESLKKITLFIQSIELKDVLCSKYWKEL